MKSRREQYQERLGQLKTARASWEVPWMEISEQLVPYRSMLWDRYKRNRGDKGESKILNNAPVRALNTLVAGMMAGITSPARRWFALTTVDPELAKYGKVKEFLDLAEERVDARFLASNWYSTLSNSIYPDLGSIGTTFAFGEDDGEGNLRYRGCPIGEYYLDEDHAGRVDTCYREIPINVRQCVQKFGYAACSSTVRNAWDQGNYQNQVIVVHAIQPNERREYGMSGPRGMEFVSCWWDVAEERRDLFLRESGYEEFPGLAPRWSERPGDVYGRGPGWSVRGDTRVLQHHEKRGLTMIDKITDPPMKLSEGIARASLLPGDKTYLPEGVEHVAEPIMLIDPAALGVLDNRIGRNEDRINRTFLVDLWQTFLNDDRAQRATATEIDAKREERMLMLGPVLENLDPELLEPAVMRNFQLAMRNDELPPVPDELHGQEIKVKFISIMHDAQQIPKLSGIRTVVGEVGALANLRPDALDKLNADVIVDEIVAITGVRSDAVLSEEQVNDVRQQKAQRMAQQQANADAMQATQGAKNLSALKPQTLSDVAGALAPAAAAQGGAYAPSGPTQP